MDEASIDDIRQEAQEMFFTAALHGYASAKSGLMKMAWGEPEISNGRMFEEKIGPYWVVQNRYVVGGNDQSAGWMLMLYDGAPVWQMQYWGRYEKRAIPFLKAALRANYKKNVFLGGRGPAEYTDPEYPNLIYLNVDAYSQHALAFENFSGLEAIDQGTRVACVERLGFHRYQGGFLI